MDPIVPGRIRPCEMSSRCRVVRDGKGACTQQLELRLLLGQASFYELAFEVRKVSLRRRR